MIKQFNDVQVRKSGVIYQSTLEQIKKLYVVDPEKAGELAISAIELVLTGGISSDDIFVGLMLEPTKYTNKHNQDAYDAKVENSRLKKIEEQKLDQIAALDLAGLKQTEIAKRLGLTQQTVSYRLKAIRANYPELLQRNLPNDYQNTKDTKTLPNVYQNTNDTKDTKILSNDTKENLPNVYQNTNNLPNNYQNTNDTKILSNDTKENLPNVYQNTNNLPNNYQNTNDTKNTKFCNVGEEDSLVESDEEEPKKYDFVF